MIPLLLLSFAYGATQAIEQPAPEPLAQELLAALSSFCSTPQKLILKERTSSGERNVVMHLFPSERFHLFYPEGHQISGFLKDKTIVVKKKGRIKKWIAHKEFFWRFLSADFASLRPTPCYDHHLFYLFFTKATLIFNQDKKLIGWIVRSEKANKNIHIEILDRSPL